MWDRRCQLVRALVYNKSMMRIIKRDKGWVVELDGYGHPKLRNFYSKFDDAVDYVSSSLKYEFKNNSELPDNIEIG